MDIADYDPDVPEDPAFMTAALHAHTVDGLLEAAVSRHQGADTVLVAYRGGDLVPFEDLAVAKGELDLEKLLASAGADVDDLTVENIVPLDGMLRFLAESKAWLVRAMEPDNENMARLLSDIANHVMDAAGLLDGRDS